MNTDTLSGARVLSQGRLPDGGHLLTLRPPSLPALAPGHWIELRLPDQVLASAVLDHSPDEQWLSVALPADSLRTPVPTPGQTLTLQGPFGEPLPTDNDWATTILISDGHGLPALLFLARLGVQPHLALVTFAGPPWVRLRPSRFMLPSMPAGVIAGIGQLEEAGVPSRVSHADGLPGCHDGGLEELLSHWLDQRPAETRWQDRALIIGRPAFVDATVTQLRGRIGQYRGYPIAGAGD